VFAVNVVGVGFWGAKLVRCFAAHPRARVNAVCDLSGERVALVRREFPNVERFTTDPVDAVTDPRADAVVIATPAASHFELAQAALKSGKHVLVEKPICDSVAAAEALVDLAGHTGKQLSVGHVYLFSTAVRFVRRLIRTGELGSIRYIHSTRANLGPIRHDVNALWDLASHDVSIFNFWLGGEPIDVTARGQSYLRPDVEDLVVTAFTYPNRVVACAHVSWLNPRKVREITVVGSRKAVVWDDTNAVEPLRVYRRAVTVERPTFPESVPVRLSVRSGDAAMPNVAGPEPLVAECDHFIRCAQGKAKPVCDGAWGLAVVRALEASDKSMREQSRKVGIRAVAREDSLPGGGGDPGETCSFSLNETGKLKTLDSRHPAALPGDSVGRSASDHSVGRLEGSVRRDSG
jgi:predicted dehydrogenase